MTTRFDRLDALRATAILWMAAFHFCFDLNHFKFISQNFYKDPFWTVQRVVIVSLFMFCAGMGQAIAWEQRQGWPRFWRRWAQVAGCALLVTAGSYLMFPQSFIYFGVLHGIAVMLVVVRLTAGWGHWLLLAGALAIASQFIEVRALDGPAFNWIGWVTEKPVTEDYVPVFPWLGVMWWGLAAGQWVIRERPQWLAVRAPRPLAAIGRWSLTWYMAHQPVLIGLLMLAR